MADEEDEPSDVFVFSQHTPSKEWLIHHYLGGIPEVSVHSSIAAYSTGGYVDYSIRYIDNYTVEIVFDSPTAGEAFLSF